MKLVAVSNQNLDTVADILVAENVHERFAAEMMKAWNKLYCYNGARYYMTCQDDDYVLWRGMEEFI